MKAIRIVGQGGPEVLRLEEVVAPAPGPSDILVRVRASAVNRADLLQCRGAYPAPADAPPDIPGLEYAGEVLAAGPRARRFKVGDRVMGLVGGGAFAEQLVVHEREAAPIPVQIDFAHAAAIPEAFITAFDAMHLQGDLLPSEYVLIHAVTSGVGTAAVQLAMAAGAIPIGTGRSAAKLARCRTELGLQHALEVTSEPPTFAAAVREASSGRGADLALDLVGGTYFNETVRALNLRGRILSVGLLAGRSTEVDLGALMNRRIRVIGTVLRSRPLEEKILAAQAFERHVCPLLESGRVRPVVDEVFAMADVQRAFARIAENTTFGKVVLAWP